VSNTCRARHPSPGREPPCGRGPGRVPSSWCPRSIT